MSLGPAAVLALLVLLAGCESHSYGAPPALPPAPPPVPVAPPAAEEPPAEPAEAVPAPGGKRAGKTKREREASAAADNAPRKSSAPAASAAPKPPAPPSAAKAPAPAEKAPAPAARNAKGSVRVPESAHVRIELPSGLQDDLDRDPRMQSWVNKAASAIERCYAPLREAGASGVIEVRLVMHENERPSAEPGKFPSALTPMLACVTGDLMRAKMPLFTGKEGTRYTLKVRLSK